MLPIHLEGCDVFAALAAWVAGGERRNWTLQNWSGAFFRCSLTWPFGDSQIGGIDKVAVTPQEAALLALEEFKGVRE